MSITVQTSKHWYVRGDHPSLGATKQEPMTWDEARTYANHCSKQGYECVDIVNWRVEAILDKEIII